MSLIDDQGVILVKVRVLVYFSQQHAIGHQLDMTPRAHTVMKPHLVADTAP